MSGWPTSAPTARRSPPSTGKPHSPKPPEPETTTDAGRRWTGSPEEEIEWEFLTGLSIDYSSIATEAYGNIPQAIPYVEQALAKLEKYPLEERVHFEKLCREELADIYLYADDPRAAGQIGRCIDLHRAWVAADKHFERPAATRRNT